MKANPRIAIIGLASSLACLGVLVTAKPSSRVFDDWGSGAFSEAKFYAELNECTTGLVGGSATPDGKPLLWKNRDVGNSRQEFHYVDDGRIPFIGITYENEQGLDEYYGGINAEGFAVENSNSYNLAGGPGRGPWGYGDDDGEIQMLALATCRTVDDFEELLEWTNGFGRTLNCNYGAFDAYGDAAMFETAGYTFARIDAAETPEGFIVRANYSYSGAGLDNRSGYWGPNRHDRAYEQWKTASDDDRLTPIFHFQQVTRNLNQEGMNDYRLPYNGYWGNYPYGILPNGEAICRSTTRAIMVAQGVRPGEHPDHSKMWVSGGNQIGTIFTPLWVRAGSVPPEYDSENGGRICRRGIDIADWVYEDGGVNTFKLTNPQRTGIWDYTLPLERWVYDKVIGFENSPEFSLDRLEGFQNQLARQVADSLDAWHPSQLPTEIRELIFDGGSIVLRWGEVLHDGVGGVIEPLGYEIYRSAEPFRQVERGEFIAFTTETEYVDDNPLRGGGFYRVEAVY